MTHQLRAQAYRLTLCLHIEIESGSSKWRPQRTAWQLLLLHQCQFCLYQQV